MHALAGAVEVGGVRRVVSKRNRACNASTSHRGALSLLESFANKESALRLRVSEVTVERHVTSLLRKAPCDSRARLIGTFWRLSR